MRQKGHGKEEGGMKGEEEMKGGRKGSEGQGKEMERKSDFKRENKSSLHFK